MILRFPDLDTLRLALITGAVPSNISQTGALAGFDEQGQCWVETSATLNRTSQAELKKLGVQTPKAAPAGLAKEEASCWAEILPLERDRNPVERLEQTAVLFDLSTGEAMAHLAIEILRLGNDRQGFRWLEDSTGGNRALLRVDRKTVV